jgi:hypothetical protein
LISGLSYKTAFNNELLTSIFSVVADEAKLAEPVHEEADAGSRRSNHFGQCFLDCQSDLLAVENQEWFGAGLQMPMKRSFEFYSMFNFIRCLLAAGAPAGFTSCGI